MVLILAMWSQNFFQNLEPFYRQLLGKGLLRKAACNLFIIAGCGIVDFVKCSITVEEIGHMFLFPSHHVFHLQCCML